MNVLYTREWWRFRWYFPAALDELRRARGRLAVELTDLNADLIEPDPRPPTPALVSVEEARSRLRLDADFPEADIELAIAGASEAVMAYLKRATNYSDPDPAPPQVTNAVLLLTGTFIRDPDGVEAQNWDQGYLPRAVTALLFPLRDPASA